jgi:methionyl-tRNA synthetase
MSETQTPFYITTAISYPNGRPHIGHAYEAIATDVMARFQRARGRDVRLVTGTDEHGLKMYQTARDQGRATIDLADEMSGYFREMYAKLNISYDVFMRTSDPAHHAASQAIWRAMAANGDLYLDRYEGWYSVRDEAYYDESELTGGEGEARLSPQGTPVEWSVEESWFFRLSAYQDRLLKLYADDPAFVRPEAKRNEVVRFVEGGLADLSISRTTFDWGVPVPGDPKHVMYVWVDALTNYLTGVGYPDTDPELLAHAWPADVHIIGKDIVRFHAVYWPAFLMSAGLALPKKIFAHGFLFNRGEKMSKSVGNVVDPFVLADTYGVDPVRYFLLREVPFGQDGSYGHEAIVQRMNADLANDLGNLAQRSLTMVARNCAGRAPVPGALTAEDEALLAAADGLHAEARAAMADFALHLWLGAAWRVVGDANRYFATAEPWVLRKSDPERMATVLWVTLEVLRQVAILVQPAMPAAMATLLDLLAVPDTARDFAALGPAGRIAADTPLPPPRPVFPRFVEPEEGEAAE